MMLPCMVLRGSMRICKVSVYSSKPARPRNTSMLLKLQQNIICHQKWTRLRYARMPVNAYRARRLRLHCFLVTAFNECQQHRCLHVLPSQFSINISYLLHAFVKTQTSKRAFSSETLWHHFPPLLLDSPHDNTQIALLCSSFQAMSTQPICVMRALAYVMCFCKHIRMMPAATVTFVQRLLNVCVQNILEYCHAGAMRELATTHGQPAARRKWNIFANYICPRRTYQARACFRATLHPVLLWGLNTNINKSSGPNHLDNRGCPARLDNRWRKEKGAGVRRETRRESVFFEIYTYIHIYIYIYLYPDIHLHMPSYTFMYPK